MDIVRAGITTYGMYPSDEVEKERVPLKPAMELISHVARVETDIQEVCLIKDMC